MTSARNTSPARGIRGFLGLALVASLLAAAPTPAEVALVLEDGQVVAGADVELKDGQYLLELRTGSVLALPVELVRELRLTEASGAEERPEQVEDPAEPRAAEPEVVAGQPIPEGAQTGLREGEPEIVAGRPVPDGAPTGLRVGEPQVLAGPPDPIPFPTRAEQLAAFRSGESRFARSVIDTEWRPTDGWLRPGLTDFNPARWYQAPIDSTWDPEPAYTIDSDVTNFNPARWQAGSFDQRWYPEDGFARRDLWAGGDRSPFAGRFWVDEDLESQRNPD